MPLTVPDRVSERPLFKTTSAVASEPLMSIFTQPPFNGANGLVAFAGVMNISKTSVEFDASLGTVELTWPANMVVVLVCV